MHLSASAFWLLCSPVCPANCTTANDWAFVCLLFESIKNGCCFLLHTFAEQVGEKVTSWRNKGWIGAGQKCKISAGENVCTTRSLLSDQQQTNSPTHKKIFATLAMSGRLLKDIWPIERWWKGKDGEQVMIGVRWTCWLKMAFVWMTWDN